MAPIEDAPWSVRVLGDGGIVETSGGIQFGRCLSTHAVNMSSDHARLIAAAPELLAALRDLCDAIPMGTLKADPPLEAWWQIAQAAIAKAEGK